MAANPPFVPRAPVVAGNLGNRRSRRHDLAVWWREIDKVLLVLVLLLIVGFFHCAAVMADIGGGG